jgi:hypothetical protein
VRRATQPPCLCLMCCPPVCSLVHLCLGGISFLSLNHLWLRFKYPTNLLLLAT